MLELYQLFQRKLSFVAFQYCRNSNGNCAVTIPNKFVNSYPVAKGPLLSILVFFCHFRDVSTFQNKFNQERMAQNCDWGLVHPTQGQRRVLQSQKVYQTKVIRRLTTTNN